VTRGAAERHLRTAQAMRDGLAPRPALRLTMEGLLVLAAAARRPVQPDELTGLARAQLDILRGHGLIGNLGTPTEQAAPVTRALIAPNVRLRAEIGTARGRASWSAWLGAERAVVAVRADPASDDLAVFIVPPGWAPVMAVRWLGVGPRPKATLDGAARLPLTLLQQRLADPATPIPAWACGELRTLWGQPLVLWGLKAEPGGFGMLVLDAGQAGFWQALPRGNLATGPSPDDTGPAGTNASDTDTRDADSGPPDDVMLCPLPPGEVWRRVARCVVGADAWRRAARAG
jgi:hypothetical protein